LDNCLHDGVGEEEYWSASDGFESLSEGSAKNSPNSRFRIPLFYDSEEETEGDSLQDMFEFDLQRLEGGGNQNIFSDEEEDGELEEDIDEMYAFDLQIVAKALQEGADKSQLQDIIESEMQKKLEEKLAKDATGIEQPSQGAVHDMPLPQDVAGLMTPPDGNQADISELAERLKPVAARRRSSIAQHPELLQAVGAARAVHRKSVVQAAAAAASELQPGDMSKVRQSIAATCRNRRASLIKAAEVLEAAGVTSSAEVSQQLKMVHRAVEGARRKYRQSLAAAVEAAEAASVEAAEAASVEVCEKGACDPDPATPTMSKPDPAPPTMPCQGLSQQRMNEVIAAAYAKRANKAGGKKNIAVQPNYTALASMQMSNGKLTCGPPKRAVRGRCQRR